jgi:ABC-type phosphate transport system substrate-binding protein
MPTLASLANGRYLLAKEIHFVTSSHPSDSVRKFMAFIYSDKGRNMVEKIGVLTVTGGK